MTCTFLVFCLATQANNKEIGDLYRLGNNCKARLVNIRPSLASDIVSGC
jgi:hypothetical protein